MPDISVRPAWMLISLSWCSVPAHLRPRHIRGQQSTDLFHEFCQFLIPPEGKRFILFTDEP